MKPPVTCILLMNGNRARFLFHDGPGRGFRLDKESDIVGPNLHERDIQADRPGRTFDRKGPGRHALESASDVSRTSRMTFFEDVTAKLDAKQKETSFSRLVLVAPSRVAVEFKPLLSGGVSDKVYAELHKDLTQSPVSDLPRHLESVMVP